MVVGVSIRVCKLCRPDNSDCSLIQGQPQAQSCMCDQAPRLTLRAIMQPQHTSNTLLGTP
jgi:hypothetical protein